MITAENITEEQIRELRESTARKVPRSKFETRSEALGLVETCNLALDAMPIKTHDDVREFCRARCAEILNARAASKAGDK